MKHELIKGEHIVVPPPTFGYSTIQHKLAHRMRPYVLEHAFGEVYIEAGFKLSLDTFLQPAVSFLRAAHLNATDPDGYFEGSPAITVEIYYKWNTVAAVRRKVELFLAHGAEEAWVIDPQKREVRVHRRHGDIRVVAGGEMQSDLLPGWSMNVAALFEN